MNDTNQTIALLCRVAFIISAQYDQILQEQLGIGYAQYKILQSIDAQALPSQLSIANDLHQTEAGISRQVKLLRGMKLLEVEVDPNNRRRHLIRLSLAGNNILEAANHAIVKFNNKRIKFGEKQSVQLNDLLTKLMLF